jgi:hypothetical protein
MDEMDILALSTGKMPWVQWLLVIRISKIQ